MFIHTVHKNPELEAFRHEVREFCNAHLAPNTRRKLELGQHLERDEHDAWLRAVGAKGWLTGKWPVEHGGLGWGPEQAAILSKELGAAGAPWLIPFGTTMVGPAIYTFGTEAQKQQYLPAIAANETWWCQGYSKPGAGSDLASLRTRAVLDGDTYVVNGQKIWTTLAHWANMMFYLVRTDPDVKKQDGISFLLIDMNTPGITVKPIVSIDMSHHLNEVFFDDVRVPRENLIGEPNKGWTYAKFLLANERVGVAEVGKFKRYISQYQQLLAQTSDAGKPLLENQEFRAQLADLNTRLASLQALVNDQLAGAASMDKPSMIGAFALKIRGSELQQAILESIMEVLGRHGLAYETDALLAGWNGELTGPEQTAGLMHEHLYRRAATIYGDQVRCKEASSPRRR